MSTAEHEILRPNTGYAATWLRQRLSAIRQGFRTHAAIYTLAAGTYAVSILESWRLGRPVELGLAGIFSSSTLMVIAAIICFRLLVSLIDMWRAGYSGSPSLALLRILAEDILTPGRIANATHAFLALGLFTIGFVTIKTNIPAINPFSWDTTLMRLDRAIHFGMLPSDILAPLRQPLVILALNVLYGCWFFVMMGFFMWQGIQDTDTPLRQRYIIAYLACWLLGTAIIGTIFSSAGPCYFGRVVLGPNPYAELMRYLGRLSDEYPNFALNAQQMLWETYVNGKGTIAGISAMPSMHVGTSVLFFLCARAAGIRWLTWFCAVFAVLIFIGSVMLGWHYAADGYAGAMIALACWTAAGWWVGRTGLSSRPS